MIVDLNTKITLLNTFHLCWESNDHFVKGRDFHALSIRLTGNAEITNGEKKELLSSGSVLFVPKGVDYHTKTGKEDLLVVHFITEGYAFKEIKSFQPKNFGRLIDLFSRLYDSLNNKAEGYQFKSLSLFYGILYELEKSENDNLSPDYNKIKGALDFLHANFTNPELNIKDLCKKSFFSDTYFRKLFFNLYNTTPLNYLNDLRLNHACALLGETNYTISRIAVLSGFYDEKYFCKLFKKKTSLTPTEFRNNL